MYFAKKNKHTTPEFINAAFLPLIFLYYEPLSELMLSYENGQCPVQTTLFCLRYLLHKTLKTLNAKKHLFKN